MSKNGKTILFPYQKQGVKLIEHHDGRVLLGDEMGLGKTLQVLKALQRNPEWLPALVICPASVKYSWQYEAAHHVGLESSVCAGQKPPVFNRRDFSTLSPLTIINYDVLRFWVKYLKKLNFKTIVIDESQYLGNPRRKRTKAVKDVAAGRQHVIALSGTPLTNRPAELFPTINLLWPDAYPSFYSYAQKHCDPKWTPYGRFDYSGSANLPELHRNLKRLGMIRRRKVDVLQDLPDQVRCVIPCELSRPEEYEHANRHFMDWLRENHGHKVRAVSRAEGLAKVGYLLRLVAKLKLRAVVNWANRFLSETDEKLIMFAVHKKCISALRRQIPVKSVTIDGSVTGRMRYVAVEQFQKDPKTRLCLGNIQAAGVGLTLTAASTSAFAEIWWKPGAHIQAEKRTDRIGQTRKSWVNYLIAGGTIEEKLCQLLQKKQKVISAVLDGGSTPQDLNIYDELLTILEGRIV